jgi:hypothetical protein
MGQHEIHRGAKLCIRQRDEYQSQVLRPSARLRQAHDGKTESVCALPRRNPGSIGVWTAAVKIATEMSLEFLLTIRANATYTISFLSLSFIRDKSW